MIKNEAEEIRRVLRYHLEVQDFDIIIVKDNNSYDNTFELIESLNDPRIILQSTAPAEGYNQEVSSTDMAFELFNTHKCDWVFPIDADEYWHSPAYGTVRDALTDLPVETDVVQTYQFDFRETSLDNPDEKDYLIRMRFALVNTWTNKIVMHNLGNRLKKVLFGNHFCLLEDGAQPKTIGASHLALVRFHYPYVSFRETIRRILNQVEGFIIRTNGEWLKGESGFGDHVFEFYSMIKNGTFKDYYKRNMFLTSDKVKRQLEDRSLTMREDMLSITLPPIEEEDEAELVKAKRRGKQALDRDRLWMDMV